MFRRGPFRRAERLFRGMGQPRVRPLLRRANQLLENGEYAQAQEAFEALASRDESNFPERAPFLFLQAGQAAILAGNTQKGIAYIRSSLTILGTQQRYPRLQAFGQRAVDELNARGLTKEAAEIADVIKANLPASAPIQAIAQDIKRPTLPTHCPSCGAGLKPNEVEWLDESTAECAYCGSPVQGE